MSDKRQKNRLQMVRAFTEEGRSDAPKAGEKGTETRMAKRKTESLAGTERLMEEVCGRENCLRALRRVKANKGSPGIDGMRVGELSGYLKQHWPAILEQLLSGAYQPQAVRRVPTGLEGILRLLRNTLGVAKVGGMDATQVAICDLEAVEAGDGAIREIASTEHRC
jgi:hypothetical protein